jgi:hypothetical protein
MILKNASVLDLLPRPLCNTFGHDTGFSYTYLAFMVLGVKEGGHPWPGHYLPIKSGRLLEYGDQTCGTD